MLKSRRIFAHTQETMDEHGCVANTSVVSDLSTTRCEFILLRLQFADYTVGANLLGWVCGDVLTPKGDRDNIRQQKNIHQNKNPIVGNSTNNIEEIRGWTDGCPNDERSLLWEALRGHWLTLFTQLDNMNSVCWSAGRVIMQQ